MRPAAPHTLLFLQSIGLAVVLTWPAAIGRGTYLLGAPAGDGTKHAWTLWWMRQEFWGGTSGLQTGWVNHPDGMPLFPIEPLDGVFAILLPLAPVLLANLLAILDVTLVGICAGWLGRLVGGTRGSMLAAGLLVQASAFTSFTLHVGVGELRQFWWIPLGLACLVRAQQRRTRGSFLLLGACLGGATVSCFYHGLFLAVALAVYALATLERDRRLFEGYVLAVGLGLVIVLPILGLFTSSYGGTAPPTPILASSRNFLDYRGAALELQEIFTPQVAGQAAQSLEGENYAGGRYFGIVLLGLVALGTVASPRRAAPWLAVAGACTVLALGTVLWVDGHPVQLGVVLPFGLLNVALEAVAEPLNFPARFVAPAMVALAVVATQALRWRWTALIFPIAALDIVMHDRTPWPRATTVLPDVREISIAAGEGAVADLRVAVMNDGAGRWMNMACQMVLLRPVQAVPIERFDHWYTSGSTWVRALPVTESLYRIFTEGAPPSGLGPRRADAWLLQHRGFDRVLFTYRNQPNLRISEELRAAFGPPLVSTAFAEVFAVAEVDASPAESAMWLREHAERAARLEPINPLPGAVVREAP